MPFGWDTPTIEHGLKFTLTTELGEIDLLASIPGGVTYEDILPECVIVSAFGVDFQCVGLAKLVELKRAAGRPKDLEAIAELKLLQEDTTSNVTGKSKEPDD